MATLVTIEQQNKMGEILQQINNYLKQLKKESNLKEPIILPLYETRYVQRMERVGLKMYPIKPGYDNEIYLGLLDNNWETIDNRIIACKDKQRTISSFAFDLIEYLIENWSSIKSAILGEIERQNTKYQKIDNAINNFVL